VFGAISLKISNTLIFSGELMMQLSRNTGCRGLRPAISWIAFSLQIPLKKAGESGGRRRPAGY
jgi:hypothetical protein